MSSRLYIFERSPVAKRIYLECLFKPLSKKELSNRIFHKWYPNAIVRNIDKLEHLGYVKFYRKGVGVFLAKIKVKGEYVRKAKKRGGYQSTFRPFYDYMKKKHGVAFTSHEKTFLEYFFKIVLTRDMFDSQNLLEVMESRLVGLPSRKYTLEDIVGSQPLIIQDTDFVTKEIILYFENLVKKNDTESFKGYVEKTFGFKRTVEVRTKQDFYEIFLFNYATHSLPNLIKKIKRFSQPVIKRLERKIETIEEEKKKLIKELNDVKRGKTISRNK